MEPTKAKRAASLQPFRHHVRADLPGVVFDPSLPTRMRRFRLIQGPMKVDVDRQIGGLCELQDRPPAKVGFVTLHRNIRIRDIDELLRLTRDPLHVQVLFELLLSENMARLADGLEENGVPSLRLLRFTAHLY